MFNALQKLSSGLTIILIHFKEEAIGNHRFHNSQS